MNIFKLAAEIFLVYLLYKLIFDFIVPLYRSAKRVKSQMNKMREKMEQHHATSTSQPEKKPETPKEEEEEGEYIDYEEVR